MAISYEQYLKSQSNFETKHFKIVCSDTLIDMFGHELSFNQLYKYIKDGECCVDLKVAIKKYDHLNDLTNVTVWINDDFVGDIRLKKNDNPIMFAHFQQLDAEDDEEN